MTILRRIDIRWARAQYSDTGLKKLHGQIVRDLASRGNNDAERPLFLVDV